MQESSHITSWVGAMELSPPRFWRPKGLERLNFVGEDNTGRTVVPKKIGINSIEIVNAAVDKKQQLGDFFGGKLSKFEKAR